MKNQSGETMEQPPMQEALAVVPPPPPSAPTSCSSSRSSSCLRRTMDHNNDNYSSLSSFDSFSSSPSALNSNHHQSHRHACRKQRSNSSKQRLRLLWLLFSPVCLLYAWQQFRTHRLLHYSVASTVMERTSSQLSQQHVRGASSPSAPSHPDWVIFYNIFIPEGDISDSPPVENTRRIVREQIGMIRRSFAGGGGKDLDIHNNNQNNNHTHQHSSYSEPVKVFYNTIGNGNVITADFMQTLCTQPQHAEEENSSASLLPVLDCQHMQHYPSAFEEVTLQKLHDYCTNNDSTHNTHHRVVYLHSKGTYHDHADRRNEHWRRHGTLAATSRDCIHPPPHNNNSSTGSKCNLCGLQFWTYWVHFMPGNFWTAQCDYVKKLLPPMDFMQRINDVSGEALLWTLQGKFDAKMFSGRNDHFGIDRFASEHWIGSHPDLIPCDVSPSDTGFGHWISGGGAERKQDAFEFGMAPRRDGSPVGEEVKTRPVILKNETLRKREFFLLPGRLFKWMRLYGKVPPSDSWIWKWYPDGDYWKQAVSKHGNQTLEIMLGGGGTSNIDSHTSDVAAKEAGQSTTAITDTDSAAMEVLDPEQSPKWAIFHHIVVPIAKEQTKSWTRGVADQLDVVSQSYAATAKPGNPVTLFYNAVHRGRIGNGTREVQDAMIQELCRSTNAPSSIHCQTIRQSQHIPEQRYNMMDSNDDHSLDTLQSMMDFCQTHESWRVIYIHNGDDAIDLDRQRLQIQAATSSLCLQPNNDNDKCNVCGLEFVTQPANAMEGNTFAAKCSYINQLRPPRIFESRMQDVAKQSLLMRAQEKFRMTLFREVGEEHFGIGPFASHHWIGSHPQVKPCHVRASGTAADSVGNTLDGEQSFSWSLAPRTDGVVPPSTLAAGFLPDKKRQLDLNRLKRAPEYFYLSGRVFKWLALYNETPSESSWVWDHFADGKEWKEALSTYGHDAVTKVLDHPPLLYGSSPEENDLRVNLKTSPGWAIFYNVYIPTSEDETEVQRGLRIFEEQMKQVRESYAASIPGKPVTVFYNTIGKALSKTYLDGVCSQDDSLICKHMAHYDEGVEGLTQQSVWDYCQIDEHKSHRAVYIHSKGSYHAHDANDSWRRHSTMAVTGQECLNPPDKACNLCGLQFYPVWNVFFPGNFWAGSCKYISKLISPDSFPPKLEEMAAQLRKYEKEQRLFANKLYDHGLPWANGADRYAWEIWSGTHPSINPCDVSTTADHDQWRTQGNRSKDEFVFKMGPRHDNLEGPWLMLEEKRRKNVLDKFGLRMRDYFLLPGNLAKWLSLYNEAPPPSSWVWNWFPDGKAWKRAVQKHGTQAFEKMTDRWDKSIIVPKEGGVVASQK